MHVLIIGGDGFCGWPTSLRFSELGHLVSIVDNLSRRKIDDELGHAPLSPIAGPEDRLARWRDISGQEIAFHTIDLVTDFEALKIVIERAQPDVIIHFAEQRSAPYSMLTDRGRNYTVSNNITATHHLLCAISVAAPDAHLIHLGSIGVYGYASAGMKLPEGYMKITGYGADGEALDDEILYPGRPDSIYHLTKLMDQQLFAFYARTYAIRCTDLHQGIVWGSQTSETRMHPDLVNRFDYDAVYGTVVNRFLTQAACQFPLTIYGSGEQTRAFIHLEDTIDYIVAASETPPDRGTRPRIVNQIAETSSIAQLARRVSDVSGCPVQKLENPRKEPPRNEFKVDHSTVAEVASPRFTLQTSLAQEYAFVQALAESVNPAVFLPTGS